MKGSHRHRPQQLVVQSAAGNYLTIYQPLSCVEEKKGYWLFQLSFMFLSVVDSVYNVESCISSANSQLPYSHLTCKCKCSRVRIFPSICRLFILIPVPVLMSVFKSNLSPLSITHYSKSLILRRRNKPLIPPCSALDSKTSVWHPPSATIQRHYHPETTPLSTFGSVTSTAEAS